MDGPARIRRLRWHCRRGMKELDLLFEQFLSTHCDDLTAGRWPELEDLLRVEDDLLWDWLQDPQKGDARPFHELLKRIRDVRA